MIQFQIILAALALGSGFHGSESFAAEKETQAKASSASSKQMSPIITHYLKIHDALASDSMEGVKGAAQAIAASSKKVSSEIRTAALSLAKAKDLDQARDEFKKLSEPVAKWVKENASEKYLVAKCSMAGASWVQKKGDIQNPYMGKKMLACGEKV